jgi:hypothetical protein
VIEMFRPRALVGLSLLCALVISAFAASSATAWKGTTAFVCESVKEGAGFEDEHCQKEVGSKAKFKHEELKPGTNTQLTVGNTETAGKLVSPKLAFTIAGVKTEIEAEGFTSCKNKTSAENKEVEGGMEVAGETCGEFTGVVVTKPAKCTVKGKTVFLKEKGKAKTVVKEEGGKQEMFVEFTPPEVFAEITFEGAECALKGMTLKVTGSAQANNTTEEGKLDGPTIKFTTAQTEKTLKVGAGAAKFEATFTARMLEGSPIGLTTTALGPGSPTETSLTTSLSGEEKSGETITVNEGAKVKDQATLSGTNASKATGTVTYSVYSDSKCEKLVTKAGEVSVSEGKAGASEEKELEAGATYYWQAVYSGDAKNLGSSSTCGKEVLNVKAKMSISTLLSGEEQSGTEIIVKNETPVTDGATLSGTNSSKATGTVTYSVYSDSKCEKLVTKAGEVSVSEGKAPASSEELFSFGTYYWQAVYSGDSTHQGVTATCGGEVEFVTAETSLTTSLTSEVESGTEIEVREGDRVGDTATLSGESASKATGAVGYSIFSDSKCEKPVGEAGIVPVTEGTIPPSSEVFLPAGTYYWRASYSGDALNESSTSACGSEIVVVKPAPLTTSLSTEGQSGAEILVDKEALVTDNATLNIENVATATGTVEYNVYSDGQCEELATKAGEVIVTEGKVPASNKVTLPEGVYYWRAAYSGDKSHEAATSVCGSEIEVVGAKTSLSTELTSEPESGTEIEVREENLVSDTAALSGENASKAEGSVEYKVYSDSKCKNLVTEAGNVTVTKGSIPASEEVMLPAGTYYWQAVYSGDSLNQPSTSVCGTEIATVTAASVTNTLSGGGEEGVEIELQEEVPVTDTATLHIEESGTATGTVEYNVYSDGECKELAMKAGKVTVAEGKVPASSEVTLPEGSYYWQAVYSGDESHEAATSICGKAVQGVAVPWVISLGDSYISGEGGRWAGNMASNMSWPIDALGGAAYESPANGEKGGEAIPYCHRSASAEIFIQRDSGGKLVKSKNLACSGAETTSGIQIALNGVIWKDVFKPGLDEIEVKQGKPVNGGAACPIVVCRGQAKLLRDFAEDAKKRKEKIKMIVVSISGNDFGFGPIIMACTAAFFKSEECNKDPALNAKFEAKFAGEVKQAVEEGLNNIGKAMDKAGYKPAEYTIVVQDYPSPLPAEKAEIRYPEKSPIPLPLAQITSLRSLPGRCPMTDGDAKWANTTAVKTINDTVKEAAEGVSKGKVYKVEFMELKKAFNERRLCEVKLELVWGEIGFLSLPLGIGAKFWTWKSANAVDGTEWVNQLRVRGTLIPNIGPLGLLGPGFNIQEDFHPNFWGQLALRSCVRQAYNNGAPKGGECVIGGKGLTKPGKAGPLPAEPIMKLK